MARAKNQIRDNLVSIIDKKVKLKAIGNDTRTMRDLAVDLVNASGQRWKDIADQCFLSPATVKKLAKDQTRRPQAETLERIYRHFGYELELKYTDIKPRFRNAPKPGSKAEQEAE